VPAFRDKCTQLERYSRMQIYCSSPAVIKGSSGCHRAAGACDVYRNLALRKGCVKIAGTRFPLSRARDAAASEGMGEGGREEQNERSRDPEREREREREREKGRGKSGREAECEATMIRPQKIIRGWPRDSLAV